jgi:hypothetical protein
MRGNMDVLVTSIVVWSEAAGFRHGGFAAPNG